jgi:hypothetical protein
MSLMHTQVGPESASAVGGVWHYFPMTTSESVAAEAPAAVRGRGLLPMRFRLRRAPVWWQELAFILGSYWAYSLIRNGVPTHTAAALVHADSVLGAERSIGLDFELAVNVAVADLKWLAVACNYFYATAHFIVTIGALVWMYRRHPLDYRSLRTPLYACNAVALLGYWLYPLAPPRMLEGFVDTVVVFHTWGSWGSANVAEASNQFAAMPSMHFGWALWSGIVVYRLARRRWVRALGVTYPVLTLFAIVATANHFWVDALAGALCLGFGFALQRGVLGMPAELALSNPSPPLAAA